MIILPWPDHRLSQNARQDRRALTAIRRQAREDGRYAALAEGLHFPRAPLALTLRFFPPDKRRRDLDGLLTAMKSYIDGMFLAYGLDDYLIERVTLIRCGPYPGGRVFVQLEELIL